METMTAIYMQHASESSSKSVLNLIADTDKIEESKSQPERRAPSDPFHQITNPRIQFLRLSSLAKSRSGGLGTVPPYLPSGPSLLRQTSHTQNENLSFNPVNRESSPLRHLFLSNYSVSVNTRHKRMPHAVNMPQSGFQALVLCGPGIGLSTFTSVPNEFPKALVEVANRPMVWYVLDWCYRMGVTDITIITPPSSKSTMAAALAQNPYLTSLPSPSPDLLTPADLEHTTPTADLLRLPEVQNVIKSDFFLLPCDLICGVSGDTFIETYLTRMGGLGGVGTSSGSEYGFSKSDITGLGGERSGRRGGLSIWYNTVNREESVKGEECDFMCTTNLDHEHEAPLPNLKYDRVYGTLRKLVWTMPMSELWDQCDEDKSWKIRQSLLRRHGNVKCMTQFRDSHIYLFPYWVREFAKLNEDFESVSEDLVGTWAKAEWRKPSYRVRFGVRKVFSNKSSNRPQTQRPIEEEVDLLSLSSTQITQHPSTSQSSRTGAQLASRVQAEPDDSILLPDDDSNADESTAGAVPLVPPILSYIMPSSASTPLVRRVDTTPLLLSVSLLLAKHNSIDEGTASKLPTTPFSHPSKVAGTATIAPRVTISRSDTLIDANTNIATQCVIKSSVIGAGVSIGMGSRITNCVIMSGTTVGEKCVLTGTVLGKKAKIGNSCSLVNCEVQDGNGVAEGTEGKGEKYLIGGLEDEVEGEDGLDWGGEGGDADDGDGEGISLIA